MGAYSPNAVVLGGSHQFAQISYRSGQPINGPYFINLQTVLKSGHPSYNYFRIWDARISFSLSEAGMFSGWIKVIIQDGQKPTPLTQAEAKPTPGFIVPAYFSGSYIPIPMEYLDKWYSVGADVGTAPPSGTVGAPTFTVTIQDGTDRPVALQNAATFRLVYRVAALVTPPDPAPSGGTGGGGVGAWSLGNARSPDDVEDLTPRDPITGYDEKEYGEKRDKLRRKFASLQEDLKGEIARGETPATFGVRSLEDEVQPSPVFGLRGLIETAKQLDFAGFQSLQDYSQFAGFYKDHGLIIPTPSDIEIRSRHKFDIDTGYSKPSVDLKIEFSALPAVRAGLFEYSSIVFREFIISIIPDGINRSGSHTSVTPYFNESPPSQSTMIWYRSSHEPYTFTWNRYQPGPFTPFPHKYIDRYFSFSNFLFMLPYITLQFSSYADSGKFNVYVDYKVGFKGRRPVGSGPGGSQGQNDGGVGAFRSNL